MSGFHEKIARLIILITILLMGFILYQMLILPKQAGISSMQRSLANIDREINAFLQSSYISYPDLPPESALEKEMEILVLKIPTQNEVPNIINQLLTKNGKALGIDYSLIDPQPIISAGKYNRAPIRLAFIIPYKYFDKFLTSIEEMPEIIRIDQLDMQRIQGDNKHLNVNLLISAFVMPEKTKEIAPPSNNEAIALELSRLNPFNPNLFPKIDQENKIKNSAISRQSMANDHKYYFQLQGVMFGDFVSALINNKIVYLNGYIDGWQLVKVSEQSVVLKKGSQTITLKNKI